MSKIKRLSTQILERVQSGDVFCSLEISPPKCPEDLPTLLKSASSLDRTCKPLFWSVTSHWTHATVAQAPAIRLAQALGHEQRTMMHLAVGTLTKADVKYILDEAKDAGIRSVFALRGDECPAGDVHPHFRYAIDLVKFIRDNYGDYFTVCVAGYPLKHPQAESYNSDLAHLKQKVDAGADLIITQITLEAASFVRFVKDCRDIGIQVPILPGTMAIHSYDSLQRMASLCQFSVPGDMMEALEPIKHDDQAVREYGIHRTVEMMKELFKWKTTTGIHISTLNRADIAMSICQRLGIGHQQPSATLPHKSQEEQDDNEHCEKHNQPKP